MPGFTPGAFSFAAHEAEEELLVPTASSNAPAAPTARDRPQEIKGIPFSLCVKGVSVAAMLRAAVLDAETENFAHAADSCLLEQNLDAADRNIGIVVVLVEVSRNDAKII
jgi:hypothetical protein